MAEFMAEVSASVPWKDQRAMGDCCLRGLMLDERRKSALPPRCRTLRIQAVAEAHTGSWGWVLSDLWLIASGRRAPLIPLI